MSFPNFLIIGANKGGTSSFYQYLSQHPEVFMSDIKEPMFFMSGLDKKAEIHKDEPEWQNWSAVTDPEEYRKIFITPPGIKAAGEASTAYLANPDCAARIHAFNPAMKLIAILRNPVSRAFSNYLMYVRIGHEFRPFPEVVKEELAGKCGYLPQGRHYLQLGYYGESLRTYIDQFGKDKVKVYLIEELKDKPEWLFRDAFEFLGVDPDFVPDVREKFNVNEKVVLNTGLKKLIARASKSQRYSKFVPEPLKKIVDRDITLDPDLKAQLKAMYRSDILLTQELTGKDLSAWLK